MKSATQSGVHDEQIRQMRWNRMTWDAIAAALGLSRYTVIERARKIGTRRAPPPVAVAADDRAREPLPAGHPVAWAVLNEGLQTKLGPFVWDDPAAGWTRKRGQAAACGALALAA